MRFYLHFLSFPPFTSHATDTFSFSHVVLNNIAAFIVVSFARTNRRKTLSLRGEKNQKGTLKKKFKCLEKKFKLAIFCGIGIEIILLPRYTDIER